MFSNRPSGKPYHGVCTGVISSTWGEAGFHCTKNRDKKTTFSRLLEYCFFSPNQYFKLRRRFSKNPNLLSKYGHVHTNEMTHSGQQLHFIYISDPGLTGTSLEFITNFSLNINGHKQSVSRTHFYQFLQNFCHHIFIRDKNYNRPS